MVDKHITQSPAGEFVMFASSDGRVRVECRFESDTLWLSQAMICELYGKAKATISGHIKNIFEDGELEENSVVRFYRTTASDGKNYQVQYFSLPVILAVGYRVRSPRGTQFRQWATQMLQEYLIKGFVMDDERLKNPPVGTSAVPDYFDEMLERIRDIRASERRVYLRVREIFALAADYQPSLKETTQFFQTIQNKLHFACTGHTAAELIHQRADANQPHMGLSSYKGEEVRKSDVTVAKNYLNQDEVSELNRVVNMWLDFAEDQARRRQQVFLRDWQEKLDQFLQFNDREVLQGAGTVSKKMADEKAQAEYIQFAEQQRRLKEAEGEKDIAGLLQWKTSNKK
ncbi:virulence RhuM family protein [Yersinia ruckeri]|uniref:DNA-binding protein in cluster with Type I restriction-modification system n=2 Tax=Yersinia ruckeri TaxID=29486 RepID=A0A0A8VE34_YERRU|nr:RhuM family protein [Yersinia ruckeri]EKN4182729.1 virulence RhuM family protein [Yersinia ruckeri]KGA44225.1 virulence RhuM family protein [Yersinia ruckeri ATCC 29473]MCK8554725.1 virulence RhuM family protein [Yersinia ruckeri]MCK8594874.1 virulence RhuM family protein [Yersinia ruckeri]MCK8597772.1 virulence RhuM family protein [Yersinia ruckeri]